MKTFLIIAALSSMPVWAQSTAPSEEPAIKAMPLLTTPPAANSKGAAPAAAQPTVKPAEADDSPIGLFIMPWRNSAAQKDIDRPARLMQADMAPIDPLVFERQVEYYDVLEAHANKTAKTESKP